MSILSICCIKKQVSHNTPELSQSMWDNELHKPDYTKLFKRHEPGKKFWPLTRPYNIAVSKHNKTYSAWQKLFLIVSWDTEKVQTY